MWSYFQFIAPGRSRQITVAENWLIYAFAIVTIPPFLLLPFGFYINKDLLLFWFLGVVLAVAFLTTSGNRLRPQTPSVFGRAAALLSVIVALYFIYRLPFYEKRLPMIDELSPLDQAAAMMLIALVLEATRRVIGMTLIVVVGAFLLYAVFGHLIEGPFSHRPLTMQEILDQLVFTPNGLYGSAVDVAAFLVLAFVTFGAFLDRSGGGDFFFDLANSIVGRKVGGPAKVAVVSSGLYGSISGSPTADVVTTGSFTIPLMIRTGLKPAYAGAIEATASTGGALLPPVMGTAAFLMSDFTGIPYGTIALAATLPALLYYLAVYFGVHAEATLSGLKPLDTEVPKLGTVLLRNWYFFVPIFLLTWFVLYIDRPVLSAALALLSLLPIVMWRERDLVRIGRVVLDSLHDSMMRMTGISVACAVAGLVVGTLGMTDLTGKISSAMFMLAKGSEILTLLVATVVIIVLGMGMPTPAVYALSAVIAGPALLALGVPMLPAHLFIVYFASMSAITPPVAVAAFAAGSIAGANPITIGFIACRLALVAFVVPFIFIYHPGLLLIGDATTVIVSSVVTSAAVVAMVLGATGYLFGRLGVLWRIIFGVAGVLLATNRAAPLAIGGILLAGGVVWIWLQKRRLAAA
jgi:TRAP transporter 4TM/12TM fusion protein